MRFNDHSKLVGLHAIFGASKYHWVNYDDDKLDRTYVAALAAQRGTELHAFAHEAIRLGIKLPSSRKTLHMYVNDAIGFKMKSEQVLYYSPNFFGTADAISFKRNKLRIHDLKTGVTKTSEKQLEIYAALFCLEYGYNPAEIEIELRIYQEDEVRIYEADPNTINHIMRKIVAFDKRIENINLEVMS